MSDRLGALHAAGARLAAALAFAMLLGSGYLAAPVLFADAPDRALAGELAGAIFARANAAAALFLLALGLFFWRLQRQGRLRWALWGLALGCVLMELLWFSPEMQAIKAKAAAMGGLEALASEHPLRQRFGLWHAIGSVAHLLATLALGGLIAIGTCTESKGR